LRSLYWQATAHKTDFNWYGSNLGSELAEETDLSRTLSQSLDCFINV
jgi:hypothetical protein